MKRLLLVAALLVAGPAAAQVPEADAVIDAFYAAVRAGDLDAAYALTDASTARPKFNASWSGFDKVEVYMRFTGEVHEGFLLGHVDHCVGPRQKTYTNWAGGIRLKEVKGAWRIHDWDDDTIAYSIGDDCWEGGQWSMLEAQAGGAVIGTLGADVGEPGDGLGVLLGTLETEPTPEPSPVGEIELKTLEVEGGTTNAEDVVKRRLPALRACYERRLPVNPDLKGTIELTFTVAPAGGKTAHAEVVRGLDEAVDGCMLRSIARLRFEAPKEPARVRLEVSLQPVPEAAE